MPTEIGKLTLTITPEALRSIIEGGRLLELAGTIANEAAEQIASQLVDHVAAAAVKGDIAKAGASAGVSFIFDGVHGATWSLLVSIFRDNHWAAPWS
jgi:hypothetical protein